MRLLGYERPLGKEEWNKLPKLLCACILGFLESIGVAPLPVYYLVEDVLSLLAGWRLGELRSALHQVMAPYRRAAILVMVDLMAGLAMALAM